MQGSDLDNSSKSESPHKHLNPKCSAPNLSVAKEIPSDPS